MRISRIALSAAAGLVLASLLLSAQTASTAEPRKITVTAKKYEFTPNRIELKAGEPVEITFESLDTEHGFVCPDLKLEKITYKKDSPGKVAFTPEKAGTYPFKCAKFCGFGHGKMKGEFVVTAAQ
ncbi:MAG: cupredoxin domain-containing protein [Acidobacteriota bacterium]|nr:cupredoxin domain-containing protein [Acidobacteriota bacterium]